MNLLPVRLHSLDVEDRGWAETLVEAYFGSVLVVSRGVLHDPRTLPGIVAEVEGEKAGLLQYRIEGDQCEVVILVTSRPRIGIGRLLLDEVKTTAHSTGCRRLWLITTNDNLRAKEFYLAVGWRLAAVHRGAMEVSRRLKPEIPEVGMHGIPIEDEIEFEFNLLD